MDVVEPVMKPEACEHFSDETVGSDSRMIESKSLKLRLRHNATRLLTLLSVAIAMIFVTNSFYGAVAANNEAANHGVNPLNGQLAQESVQSSYSETLQDSYVRTSESEDEILNTDTGKGMVDLGIGKEDLGMIDVVDGGEVKPELTETSLAYDYKTRFGSYMFRKSRPEILMFESLEGETLVTESSFELRTSYGLSHHSPQVLEATDKVFTVKYMIRGKNPTEGSITIEHLFLSSSPPKITANLELDPHSSILSYNIVWVLHTTDHCLLNPKGDDPSFLQMSHNIVLEEEINQVSIVPCGDDLERPRLHLSWEDAGHGQLSYGTVRLFGNRGRGILVRFAENAKTIDPTLVDPGEGAAEPGHSIQRNTFNFGNYYWAFYSDYSGSEMKILYKVSHDGILWQYRREVPVPFSFDVDYFMGFDVAQSGTKVALVFHFKHPDNTPRIYVITGFISTNVITWIYGICVPEDCNDYTLSPQIDTEMGFSEPSTITIDSNGNVWVSATYYYKTGSWPDYTLRVAYKLWRLDDSEGDPGDFEWIVESYNDSIIWCSYDPNPDGLCHPTNKHATTRLLSLSHGKVMVFMVIDRGDQELVQFSWDIRYFGLVGGGGAILDMKYGEAKRDKMSFVAGSDDIAFVLYKGSNPDPTNDDEDRLLYFEIENDVKKNEEFVCGSPLPCSPFYPTISVDSFDHAHMFWKEDVGGYPYPEGILYRTKGDSGWEDVEDNFDSDRFVYRLTSPENVDEKAFLVFRRSGSEVHFASWPLAHSVSSGSASGWNRGGLASSIGGYANLDEIISPSTGFLAVKHTDVKIPGRNGLDIVVTRMYETPRVFRNNGPVPEPYLFKPFPYADVGNFWSLDFPWIDGNVIHMYGGMTFPMQFSNGEDTFENHNGLHFTFVRGRDSQQSVIWYKLHLTSGVTFLFHPDGRPWEVWNSPLNPTTKIYFTYDGTRLTFLEDDPGRAVCFMYNLQGRLEFLYETLDKQNCMQKRIVSYDYYGDVLRIVTDSVSRNTEYHYGYGVFPDEDALLSYILYHTGALSIFYYDVIPVGTDAVSYVVKEHFVHVSEPGGPGPLIRKDEYEYEHIDGKILFSKARHFDSNLDFMGQDEYSCDAFSNSVIITNKDENGLELEQKKMWLDSKGQITQTDAHIVGDPPWPNTASSLSNETIAYDEWGNIVYSRDSMGHEKYFSYANEDSRNRFFGPGVLVESETHGLLFDNFDDWDIGDWEGDATVVPQYYFSSPPSIEITNPPGGIYQTFVTKYDVLWAEIEVRVEDSKYSFSHIVLGDAGVTPMVHVAFYYNWEHEEYRICWIASSTCNDIEVGGYAVEFLPGAWYNVLIQAFPDFDYYYIYLNGVLVEDSATIDGGPRDFRSILFTTSLTGTMYVSRLNAFESSLQPTNPKGCKVYITNEESQTLYARLVAGDGSTIDVERLTWDGSGTSLYLYESGKNPAYETHIEISEHDGKTVYSSPFGINFGRSYHYSQHTEMGSLKKTQSGFWKVSNDPMCDELVDDTCILLDEEFYFDPGDYWPSQSIPGSSEGDDWIWPDKEEMLGAHGVFSEPKYFKQKGHKSEYYHEERHHWFSGSDVPLDLDLFEHVLAQYIYIPSSAVPREIALRYHSYVESDWLDLVYWGENLIPEEDPHHMGPVPDSYDRWLMLLIPAYMAGITGPDSQIDGIDYWAYGGEVGWDFSVIKDRSNGAEITVSNLPSSYRVGLYTKDGVRVLLSEEAGMDGTVSLDVMYALVYVYPFEGYFVVYDGDTAVYVSHVMDNIWAGDEYEFLDPASPLPSEAPHFYANDDLLLGSYGEYLKSYQLGTYEQQFGRFLETTPDGEMEFYVKYDDHLMIEGKTMSGDNWRRVGMEYYDAFSGYENLKSVCDNIAVTGGCKPGYLTEYEWSSLYDGTYLTESKITVSGVVSRTHYGYYFDSGNLWFEQSEKGIELGDEYRTEYEYDAANRVTKVIYPLMMVGAPPYERAEVQYDYDDSNNLISTYNENGHRTDVHFDELGRLVRDVRLYYESPNWIEYSWIEYDYYWNHKIKEESYWPEVGAEPYRSYSYEYDYLGRVTKITNPEPLTYRSIQYDFYYDIDDNRYEGYQVTAQWGLDTSTRQVYVYDWAGRLLESEEWLDGSPGKWINTKCQYNELGSLVQLIDAKTPPEKTDYTYDSMLRLREIEYNDGTYARYVYDELGDLSKTIDRNGQEIFYFYDSAHRPDAIVYQWEIPGDPESQMKKYMEFEHDENGNIVSKKRWVPDSLGIPYQESSLTYYYDIMDRPVRKYIDFLPETEWDHTLPPGEDFGISERIEFRYDKASNIKEYLVESPGEARHVLWRVVNSYDDFERIDDISVIYFHPSSVAAFEYYHDDSIETITYENGLVSSFEFWDAGLIERFSLDYGSINYLDIEYSMYYDNGNLERVDYSYDDGATTGWQFFQYDSLDRITSFEEGLTPYIEPETFTYDDAGNRLTKNGFSEGSFSYAYNYPNNNDRLTSIDKDGGEYRSYTYYPNGNLKTKRDETHVWTYNYDEMGQLTSVMRRLKEDPPVNDVIVAQYFYDPNGHRIMVAESYDSTENFKAYINIGGSPVYEFDYTTEESSFLVYGNGLLLMRCKTDFPTHTDVFYHQDALGNIRMMTASDGSALFYSNYRPFGQQYDIDTSINPEYKFAGKPEDPLTGLYYFGLRYYDSDIGRFISEDPFEGSIKSPQSLNPYVYTMNNPLKYRDPTGGLVFLVIGILIAVGIGIGVAAALNPAVAAFFDPLMAVIGLVPVFGDALSTSYFLTKDIVKCARGDCDFLELGIDLFALVPLAGDMGKIAKGARLTDLLPFIGRSADEVVETVGLNRAARNAPDRDWAMFFHTMDEGGYEGWRITKGKTTHGHHLLPKCHNKFFRKYGLRIDDYIWEMDPQVHTILHGKGGHYRRWEIVWGEWIDSKRMTGTSRGEILEFMQEMKARYNLF